MNVYLAITLDDVVKSTRQKLGESPDSTRMLAVLLGAAAIVLLLVLFNYRRKRQAAPRPLRHHGKLLREILRQLPLRSGELKQLKLLAQRQECANPLVLLLCPSLLAKGIQSRPAQSDRKTLGHLAKKAGVG
jgi:uncharacterized membrane protein YccC